MAEYDEGIVHTRFKNRIVEILNDISTVRLEHGTERFREARDEGLKRIVTVVADAIATPGDCPDLDTAVARVMMKVANEGVEERADSTAAVFVGVYGIERKLGAWPADARKRAVDAVAECPSPIIAVKL